MTDKRRFTLLPRLPAFSEVMALPLTTHEKWLRVA